jgi:hypothetical protein
MFWEKLAFEAAADASGGVLGSFTCGIIVVNGVAIFVPPGAGAVTKHVNTTKSII